MLPELPEVENVRQGLEAIVVGETVEKVEVRWPRIIESPDPNDFRKRLMGQTIERIDRRGKFLIFYFTKDAMISHLRMEGKYQLVEPKKDGRLPRRTKHMHIIFHMKSGRKLIYHDVRKFGRMSLVEKGSEFEHKSLSKLGPEPTADEFKLEDMREFLTRRTKAIKGVLLDQQVVVG